jgi:hypothetical protein
MYPHRLSLSPVSPLIGDLSSNYIVSIFFFPSYEPCYSAWSGFFPGERSNNTNISCRSSFFRLILLNITENLLNYKFLTHSLKRIFYGRFRQAQDQDR